MTSRFGARSWHPLVDAGLWSRGSASAGSVVVVASLTLRILHSSKDMALSLVDVARHFGFIEETLSVIAKPCTVQEALNVEALTPQGGAIELREVSFAYRPGDPRSLASRS